MCKQIFDEHPLLTCIKIILCSSGLTFSMATTEKEGQKQNKKKT